MEKDKKEPDFQLTGIWIPIELLANENLNLEHGFLFTLIKMLDNGGDGCYASNQYLAQVMNKSEASICNYLNDLKKEGYVINNGELYEKRRIWVRKDYEEAHSAKVTKYQQNLVQWKKERSLPKISSYDQAIHPTRSKIREKINSSEPSPATEED